MTRTIVLRSLLYYIEEEAATLIGVQNHAIISIKTIDGCGAERDTESSPSIFLRKASEIGTFTSGGGQ